MAESVSVKMDGPAKKFKGKKFRVAIIGCGGIAQTHLTAYKEIPEVEIVAGVDINPERLKVMEEKWGVPKKALFKDWKEMLKKIKPDAVDVCTPNGVHCAPVVDACLAGCHAMVEKPMAMNAEEAQSMLDTAKACGKKLMIGFVRRFGNDTRVMQDFINADTLGEIYYAKAVYLRRNGNPGGWFGDLSRSGGGPLIDLGVHVIDLTRYLMGNPRPVSVYGATFRKLGNRSGIKESIAYTSAAKSDRDICDVEDLATALVRYDNGAVLSVEASFCLNLKKDVGKVELFGTRGGLCLDPEPEIFTDSCGYLVNTTLNQSAALNFDGLFEGEINFFVDALLKDKDISSIAEDGVTIMKILDAIYLSARIGKSVQL